MALIWVIQLARWPRSRVRTSVLTPSQVERNRVTSFMHSLKPARYLPSTVGSVLSAAAGGREGHSGQQAPQGMGVFSPPMLHPAAPLSQEFSPSGSTSCAPGCQGCGWRAWLLHYQVPSIRNSAGEQTTPRSPPMPLSTVDPAWEHSPPRGSCAFHPTKQIQVGSTALLVEQTEARAAALPVPSSTRDADREHSDPQSPPVPGIQVQVIES